MNFSLHLQILFLTCGHCLLLPSLQSWVILFLTPSGAVMSDWTVLDSHLTLVIPLCLDDITQVLYCHPSSRWHLGEIDFFLQCSIASFYTLLKQFRVNKSLCSYILTPGPLSTFCPGEVTTQVSKPKIRFIPNTPSFLSPGFTLLQIPQSLCQTQVHFTFFSPEFPPIGSPHTIISHQNWLTSLLIHLPDSILFYAYLNHGLVSHDSFWKIAYLYLKYRFTCILCVSLRS